MATIGRRRFLEVGGLGLGVGLGSPGRGAGQTTASESRDSADRVVRMMGDGLGLTPPETAGVLTHLADAHGFRRDSYSNGGVVQELEEAFATTLGKERAVFLPTGTLANHLAVRRLAGGRGRAVVQAESHLFNDSGDCVQTLSGITLVPLAPGRASFTLAELEAAVDRTRGGRVAVPVSVISVETPVRRKWGETFEAPELERVVAFARREGIALHLDGARVFLQSAYSGRSVADLARPFDTVYVSLYKYFNAPSGAILAGPRALLDDLYHERRMFGAGLPAAWPFAAVAAHYLPGFLERFTAATRVAETLIERLTRHEGFVVERVPSGTNLVWLRVSTGDPGGFRRRLGDRGIQVGTPRGDGRFLLGVNETWNRRPASEMEEVFISALG